MPAERNNRGVSMTGSIRNTRASSRRDSTASNSSLPDTGFRPTSPFRQTPYFTGFSPNGTLTPGNSRPGSPFNRQDVVRNFRKTNSSNQTFTTLVAPGSPPLSAGSLESNSMDVDPSTITWDCATALVENQKVQSIYEKPVYSKTGQIISHGKVLTKTVTMTITTTIASTEILHPGEEGYHASLEKYRKQQEEKQQNQQSPKQDNVKVESKTFAEAFSPEETEHDRRNFFSVNQNDRLQEQLRKANYYSPAPSPPRSPVPTQQK